MKNRQAQIDPKINQLVDQNLEPFPYEKLEKGRPLNGLIQKILQAIEVDDLILVGMYIKELEVEGMKLNLYWYCRFVGFPR